MIQDFLTGVDRVLGHRPKLVHFTSLGDASGEDEINTEVLAAMCQEAGYTVNKLWLDHIGLGKDGRFYHIEGYHIDIIFKPYPWELMMMEKFDKSCFADMDNRRRTSFFGVNKAMFAVLWDMFKDDPRSQWLPLTYLETEKLADMTRYDRKPMFSREGDCATLQDGRHVISKFDADVYGEGGFVAQELALLPQNTNYRTRRVFYPLLGVWMVDGEPVGMGLWTNLNPITSNSSTFVPHVIECAPEVKYVRQPVPKIEEIETALAVDTYENVGFVGHNRQRDCFHT